jgi:hypothetical protein
LLISASLTVTKPVALEIQPSQGNIQVVLSENMPITTKLQLNPPATDGAVGTAILEMVAPLTVKV